MLDLIKQPKLESPLWNSLPVCHFADTGDGGGGAGEGGNKTKEEEEAKTKEEEAKKQEEEKAKGATYDIKIDGTERTVTVDELKKLAEKSGGADEVFRKAADETKKAQAGLRVMSLFEGLKEGETPASSDVTELAGLLGMDAAELLDAMGGKTDTTTGKKTEKGKKDSAEGKITAEDLKDIGLDQLSPELRGILESAKETQFQQIISDVKEKCKEAVDKDEILGKIIKSREDDAESSALSAGFIENVFKDVQRKISLREKYGPEMIKASVQELRAFVAKFGTPTQMSKHPAVLGFGPSGQLPAEVHADEPIKRVGSTDAGYEDNVVKRVMQSFLKNTRSKQ